MNTPDDSPFPNPFPGSDPLGVPAKNFGADLEALWQLLGDAANNPPLPALSPYEQYGFEV